MVINLIELSDTPRQAFTRGVCKGAAAPLMLFAANRAMVHLVELPALPRVDKVQLPHSLRCMTDLQRIGADFSAAVRRYEQADAQQPSIGNQAG